MGLFSNNKKPCPICGNPTPRLFPTEIEDQPICKECKKKIDLPGGAADIKTLSDFRQYLAAYEENQALGAMFQMTYRYSYGYHFLLLDENNGLIRLKDTDNSWILEKRYLKSFRILEDDKPLYESSSGTLKCYQSEIPGRVNALAPVITQFEYQKREYERQEEREAMRMRGKETDEERKERERIANLYRPRFNAPVLFKGFRTEITFDHPYWPSFETTVNSPTFDDTYPSIDRYLKRYREQTEELHLLAAKLMYMIDPAAGETRIGSAAAPAASSKADAPLDAVAEIRRYKELLEQGLLTEEEFTAKKRQVLGI